MDLTLHDGSVASFTAAELAQTLTRLTNTNQSYCLGTQDTAHVRVGPNLLVMDVAWTVGRKLIEGYGISYDSTFPFGLRFSLGTSHYTLNQALCGAGYVGVPSVTDLAQVYMGMYSGAAQTYLKVGQLVKSQGVFQGEAAELKSLTAGTGITLTDGADAITIDGASTLTATTPSNPDHVKLLENGSITSLMIYPPNDSGAGITIDKDTSNPGAVTIDYSVLVATLSQRAWMSDVLALQEVVENPSGASYHYLNTGDAGLSVRNGQIAVFNFNPDGTSNTQGDFTVVGDLHVNGAISNAGLQTSLDSKVSYYEELQRTGLKTDLLAPLTSGQHILVSGDFAVGGHLSVAQNLIVDGLHIDDRYEPKADPPLQTQLQTKVPYYEELQRTGLKTDLLAPLTSGQHILVSGDFAVGGHLSVAQNLIVDGLHIDDRYEPKAATPLQTQVDSLAFTPVSPLGFGLDVATGEKTLQADLSFYQPKLDIGAVVTLNVGRGDVYLENNTHDNANGAGVTLRTTDNPSGSGSIFAVRTKGESCRLWVGQTFTSTGAGDFHCGYTGGFGSEHNTSLYKHSLKDTLVTFGAPVVCEFDLTCGDLTCAALYGGAATQIQSSIASAVSTKQDKVLWDAGSLTNQSTGTQNADYTVQQQRNVSVHPVSFGTAFTSPPLVFVTFSGNQLGHASISAVWVRDNVTTTGCTLVVADRSGSGGLTLNWFAIQPDSMG